jgi:hypothetical protein
VRLKLDIPLTLIIEASFPDIKKGEPEPAFSISQTDSPLSVKHIFQFLQRLDFDSPSGRLCLEDRLFPGERVDALPGLCCRLILDLKLQKPRQRELTRGAFLDMTLNENGQFIENR